MFTTYFHHVIFPLHDHATTNILTNILSNPLPYPSNPLLVSHPDVVYGQDSTITDVLMSINQPRISIPRTANDSNTIVLSGDGEDDEVHSSSSSSSSSSSTSSSGRAQSNPPVKSVRAQSNNNWPDRGDIQVIPVRYWEDSLRQQRRETPRQWAERLCRDSESNSNSDGSSNSNSRDTGGGGVSGGSSNSWGGVSGGGDDDGNDLDNNMMTMEIDSSHTIAQSNDPVKSDRAQSNDLVKSDRAQSSDPVKLDHRIREFLNGELCIDAR